MKGRKTNVFSFSFLCLFFTILFLFLPLIVVVAYSFNSGRSMVWQGFSLSWYKELFLNSSSLWHAFKNSIIVAVSSSLAATVLATSAAIGIKWYDFKGKLYITSLTYMPMILPDVIIGISMLIFFSSAAIRLSLFTIFASHVTFNLPFVFLLVLSRLDEFDYSTIEAARDLGASERVAIVKVVLPSITPAIISGFLMSFTMSIEDFVITFFVSGPGSGTLPLYVYSSIRYGVSPVINALSFIMILIAMSIAFIFRKFLKTIASSA